MRIGLAFGGAFRRFMQISHLKYDQEYLGL